MNNNDIFPHGKNILNIHMYKVHEQFLQNKTTKISEFICYEKKAFYNVGGFQKNKSIPSGDDIFLVLDLIISYFL